MRTSQSLPLTTSKTNNDQSWASGNLLKNGRTIIPIEGARFFY